MGEFIKAILRWLLDVLLWWPRKIYELLLDGLASVIEAIPVPDFVEDASGWLAGIDPGVAYFAGALQLPAGLAIIVSAYTVRFLIRRIPVIG